MWSRNDVNLAHTAVRARVVHISNTSRFSERVDRLGNDQVIEHTYIDEREGLLESLLRALSGAYEQAARSAASVRAR